MTTSCMALFDTAGGACESRRMKTALAIVLALTAACGSKSKSDPAPKPEPVGADQKRHLEHEPMAPELSKFHDLLAPRWHADKGAQRMKDTCGAVPEFQADADAIAKATPPVGTDAAKWAAGAKNLSDAVTGLDATCKANDATAFEPAFEKVHNGFHAMLEAGGGEHHEGAEDHKM